MQDRRQVYQDRIRDERERQFMLPGSETDTIKTANMWLMTAISYLSDARERGTRPPVKDDFEADLIKASAVILAALEHCDHMQRKNLLG